MSTGQQPHHPHPSPPQADCHHRLHQQTRATRLDPPQTLVRALTSGLLRVPSAPTDQLLLPWKRRDGAST